MHGHRIKPILVINIIISMLVAMREITLAMGVTRLSAGVDARRRSSMLSRSLLRMFRYRLAKANAGRFQEIDHALSSARSDAAGRVYQASASKAGEGCRHHREQYRLGAGDAPIGDGLCHTKRFCIDYSSARHHMKLVRRRNQDSRRRNGLND